MYHNIFIQSSINGHLGCFHVLAIVSSAVVNIGVSTSFHTVCFSLDICPRMGLLNHMVALFSVFLRNLLTVLCGGYNDQSWVFIGRTDTEAETPILWPPHAKS